MSAKDLCPRRRLKNWQPKAEALWFQLHFYVTCCRISQNQDKETIFKFPVERDALYGYLFLCCIRL